MFSNWYLLVWQDDVVAWMESAEVRDVLPVKATLNNICDLIWNQRHWMECMFDRGHMTINKYNVEAFLLQLIAAGFLEAVKHKGEL